jgi:hypothetical protein
MKDNSPIFHTYVIVFLLLLLQNSNLGAQTNGDSLRIIRYEEKIYTLLINIYPCEQDSSLFCESIDTIAVKPLDIFYFVDSISDIYGIPKGLIYEIGMNESRWPKPDNINHLIKDGDLQVIERTFNYWYNQIGLTGGKNRINYLIIGCHYLKFCYDKTGSWKKARFMYGRGHWREPKTWTPLEKKFMSKINWSKYDTTQSQLPLDMYQGEQPETSD